MNVLVLSPPLAGVGGIQRYTVCLIRALRALLGAQCVRSVGIPDAANGEQCQSLHRQCEVGLRVAGTLGSHPVATRLNCVRSSGLGTRPVAFWQPSIGDPTGLLSTASRRWSWLPYWKTGCSTPRRSALISISDFSQEQVTKMPSNRAEAYRQTAVHTRRNFAVCQA